MRRGGGGGGNVVDRYPNFTICGVTVSMFSVACECGDVGSGPDGPGLGVWYQSLWLTYDRIAPSEQQLKTEVDDHKSFGSK